MKHIDEHTLELYVLGSATIRGQRRSIARHLGRCQHCRAIAQQFVEIYTEAEKHAAKATGTLSRGTMLVRSPLKVSGKLAPSEGRSSIPSRQSATQLFQYFKVHPTVTGIGGLVVLALLGIVIFRGIRPANDLANPKGFHYNLSTNNLEVYNSRDEILWKKTSRELDLVEGAELSFKSTFTTVQDLDGDGVNELITLIPVVLPDGKLVRNCVRIFNREGTLLSSTALGESVAFGSRQYDQNAFGSGGLVVVGRAGARNIVAVAPHWRSPTVVARLNAKGEILGEYWHYGHITGIYKVRLRDNGKECVVLIGGDDSRDSVGVRFPVLIVLDPDGLVGKTESPATRGFGFAASKAEIAHLFFPVTEADKALESQPYILWVTSSDEGFLHVVVQTGKPADIGRSSAVEYVLDQRFRVSGVHPIEDPYNTLALLYKKGLTRQLPDSGYFARLKDSVKYR